MKSLDLTKKEITREGFRQLSQCIHNIQTLVLIGCGVTGDDVDVLANGIEKRDTPVTRKEKFLTCICVLSFEQVVGSRFRTLVT